MAAFREALEHCPEGLCQVSQFQIGRRRYRIDESGKAHEQQCCFWRMLRRCFGDRAACRRELNVTATLRAARDHAAQTAVATAAFESSDLEEDTGSANVMVMDECAPAFDNSPLTTPPSSPPPSPLPLSEPEVTAPEPELEQEPEPEPEPEVITPEPEPQPSTSAETPVVEVEPEPGVSPAPSHHPEPPRRHVQFAPTATMRLFVRPEWERLEAMAHKAHYRAGMVAYDKRITKIFCYSAFATFASVRSAASQVASALADRVASGQISREEARRVLEALQGIVARATEAVEDAHKCVTEVRKAARLARQAAKAAQNVVDQLGDDQSTAQLDIALVEVKAELKIATKSRKTARNVKNMTRIARSQVRRALAEVQALGLYLMAPEVEAPEASTSADRSAR